MDSYKTEELRLFDLYEMKKNSLIISLYEVQDALLTTRDFFRVEDEKKTCWYIVIVFIRLTAERFKT